MRLIQRLTCLSFSLVIVLLAVTVEGSGQSVPTATQQLQLSAFGAATGTFTNLEGGKNAGITAGFDLTYLPLRLLRPSIEIRGNYPINKGTISSQKSFLGGIKVEHDFHRVHPYADFLIGRGEIDYGMGGFPLGDFLVISSTSTVYSYGGGVDYQMSRHFDAKVDAQFQHWNTPVLLSEVIHPTAVSAGVVYHFDFNPRRHRSR